MNIKIALLAACCAVALSACGDRTPETTPEASTAPPASTPEPAPAATPPAPETAPTMPAAPTPPPAATDKPAAVVKDCATEIEGNDAMQFNVGSIVVPAACKDFKITLKHTGTLAVAVMGHDVVIGKAADVAGIVADGASAGVAANHLKAGDTRVVANTDLIGGGQSTSVSFAVSKIKEGGPYEFFCSFPGHSTMMHGPISVQ